MPSTLERAITLFDNGQPNAALDLFKQAAREDPFNPEVWYHTGVSAAAMREFGIARSMLETFLRTQPAHAKAWTWLGYTYFGTGAFEQSLACYERALAIDPEYHKGLVGAGHLCRMLGRPEDSERYYDRVLAGAGTKPQAQMDRALILILRGDYERGWPLWDSYRERDNIFANTVWRPPPGRRWRGEHLPDRRVVAYQAGGFGDSLLLCRYLTLIAERVGEVVVTTHPHTDSLAATVPGTARVMRETDAADPDTLYVDMWACPAIFGTALDTVPAELPYLRVPADGPRVERAAGGTLLAGLAWSGGGATIHDRDRSLRDLEALRPLLQVPGVRWLSLQPGADDDALRLGIEPCPALADFGDTAHLVDQLDLVVSVDTAVANLAGALAKPAWIMVPTWPEWRWGHAGTTTPWYPTARLFRRRDTHAWGPMIEQMADELRELVARRAAAATA